MFEIKHTIMCQVQKLYLTIICDSIQKAFVSIVKI